MMLSFGIGLVGRRHNGAVQPLHRYGSTNPTQLSWLLANSNPETLNAEATNSTDTWFGRMSLRFLQVVVGFHHLIRNELSNSFHHEGELRVSIMSGEGALSAQRTHAWD
jgi:hypothetical protein